MKMKGSFGKMKLRVLSMICAATFVIPFIPASVASAATLNVTAYGANGSDSSDDTTAIQNAVNAASSGDTVYIPAGTYYLGGTVNGKSGVHIAGASRDTSIIKFTSTSGTTFFYLHNVSNAEVSDLTLDANNSTVALSAITSEGGDGNKMRHLKVKDFAASSGFGPFALYSIGSTNIEISDNIISNVGVNSDWGGGVRAGWGSSHALIENNEVHDTGRGGIFVNDDSPYAIVRGNTITGTGKKMEGLGIELHTNIDYSIVENNNVDHWISTVRSQYIAVRNNIVKANDGSVGNMGLEVMVNHGVTSGNLVDGGQQVGMQQSPGTGYQLWNYNTVQNIVMWGMQLQGEGTGETEQYQYFYKNTWKNGPTGNPAAAYPGYDGNAVRIHGNTKNVVFDSNQILNNGRKAIEITTASGTDRLSFINNTITGNGGPSIDQYPSGAADLEWSNNTVSGNGTNTQLTSRGFSDPKPVANFTAPLTVQLGQPITFTNTSTDNGTIVETLWDLGEGIPVTTSSPTYTYQHAGTYHVILGVWDNGGRASVKEQTVTVYTGPPDTSAPSAPGSLSAPSKSNVTVDLSWSASTDNVGVIGYDVYKNGSLVGSTSGATTFTVTGLTPSTAYSFTVKAKDAAGNVSSASNTLSVTTDAGDTQPPTAPGSLASTAHTDTSVSLYWSASSDNVGVTGYDVYYGSTLAGTTSGASATSFTATGLTPNTAYTFTVKAKDASNNVSSASNSVNVTTDPAANWVNCAGENNPCNFTGTKQVRYGANGSYIYGTYTNTVMCSNNAFGTDPAPGFYKTCDVNLAGTGGGGGGDTQAPTAPSNLTSTSVSDTSVDLSWTGSTDNVGVTGYNIYNGSTLAGTSSGTTFTVTGLTASTAYSFTVKAKDAASNVSSASNTLNVTTSSGSSANWVNCAGENNPCNFSGTKQVRYGANGSYAYGTFTNTVMCSNNAFGTDPAVGYYKTCDVNMGSSASNGLNAQYFDNMDFTGSSISRTDNNIDFSWSNGSPDSAIGADSYSVRWTGKIKPDYSGTYTFTSNTDDGVKVWVNNQLIIDKWIDQSPTDWSGTISLSAGIKYDIKVEYYENSGGASAQLSWSHASLSKQIVPSDHLFTS